MGPRVPFVSNPFGAINPNKVVKTKKYCPLLYCVVNILTSVHLGFLSQKIHGDGKCRPLLYRDHPEPSREDSAVSEPPEGPGTVWSLPGL